METQGVIELRRATTRRLRDEDRLKRHLFAVTGFRDALSYQWHRTNPTTPQRYKVHRQQCIPSCSFAPGSSLTWPKQRKIEAHTYHCAILSILWGVQSGAHSSSQAPLPVCPWSHAINWGSQIQEIQLLIVLFKAKVKDLLMTYKLSQLIFSSMRMRPHQG